MAASKAQQEATTRYNKKNYARFLVTVPQGPLDGLKEHALSRGESVNAFMKRATQNQLDADTKRK